jgi:hypothetical protein
MMLARSNPHFFLVEVIGALVGAAGALAVVGALGDDVLDKLALSTPGHNTSIWLLFKVDTAFHFEPT